MPLVYGLESRRPVTTLLFLFDQEAQKFDADLILRGGGGLGAPSLSCPNNMRACREAYEAGGGGPTIPSLNSNIMQLAVGIVGPPPLPQMFQSYSGAKCRRKRLNSVFWFHTNLRHPPACLKLPHSFPCLFDSPTRLVVIDMVSGWHQLLCGHGHPPIPPRPPQNRRQAHMLYATLFGHCTDD